MNAPLQLQPGTIFARDYRIEAPLRTGGMGAVYVATQLSTGTRRALKLMLPSFAADEAARRRFEQEARVGARIASEHVVQVIGAGVDSETLAPWIAMELLQGEELMDRIHRAGPLPLPEVRVLFEQLCHAIGAAHRARVVHRDLKPENIFLALPRSAGAVPFTIKVLDFGIAKVTSEVITMNTGTVGTPIWMAPEQTSPGHEITPATDVWALGLIAYHALTARYFWRAASDTSASMTALFREVLMDPIPPASERALDQGVLERLPRGFDAWFSRCTARDPAMRFAGADAAYAAFEPLVRGDGARAKPEPRREDPHEHAAGVPRPRRVSWLAIGAAAAVVLGGAIVATRAGREPAPTPQADPSASDPRAAIAAGGLAWQDLVLPQWSGNDDPCDTSGPAIVITSSAVLAGSPPARLFGLVGYDAPPQSKRLGAEAFVMPLGDALRRTRADRVLIIADASTHYRLLHEALSTAAQSGTTRWDLVVGHDGHPRSFAVYPPKPAERSVMVVALADRFEAYLGHAGDAGKTVWAPLAPKCEQEGSSIVPLRDSAQVTDCLAAVLRTAGPVAAVVSADADVPYGRVLVAVAALRATFGNVEFVPP